MQTTESGRASLSTSMHECTQAARGYLSQVVRRAFVLANSSELLCADIAPLAMHCDRRERPAIRDAAQPARAGTSCDSVVHLLFDALQRSTPLEGRLVGHSPDHLA